VDIFHLFVHLLNKNQFKGLLQATDFAMISVMHVIILIQVSYNKAIHILIIKKEIVRICTVAVHFYIIKKEIHG